MGHIQRKHLSQAKAICPPMYLISEMSEIIKPIIEMVISNRLEAAKLATARDTLLPELLSGALHVNDKKDGA